MLLVCQDILIPLCDGLILTHPDLLSHLKGRKKQKELRLEWGKTTTSFESLPMVH